MPSPGRDRAMLDLYFSLPATMFLEMTGTTLPAVNGLRIWPYTNYNYAPSNFEMYGGASAASPTWNLIFNPVEVNYESSKWKYFKNIQTATTYPALKFVINSSSLEVFICTRCSLLCVTLEHFLPSRTPLRRTRCMPSTIRLMPFPLCME